MIYATTLGPKNGRNQHTGDRFVHSTPNSQFGALYHYFRPLPKKKPSA